MYTHSKKFIEWENWMGVSKNESGSVKETHTERVRTTSNLFYEQLIVWSWKTSVHFFVLYTVLLNAMSLDNI